MTPVKGLSTLFNVGFQRPPKWITDWSLNTVSCVPKIQNCWSNHLTKLSKFWYICRIETTKKNKNISQLIYPRDVSFEPAFRLIAKLNLHPIWWILQHDTFHHPLCYSSLQLLYPHAQHYKKRIYVQQPWRIKNRIWCFEIKFDHLRKFKQAITKIEGILTYNINFQVVLCGSRINS